MTASRSRPNPSVAGLVGGCSLRPWAIERTGVARPAWIATMAFLVAIVVVVLLVGPPHEDHEFAWVEVARCEVADLTACDRPIGPAARSFAEHYRGASLLPSGRRPTTSGTRTGCQRQPAATRGRWSWTWPTARSASTRPPAVSASRRPARQSHWSEAGDGPRTGRPGGRGSAIGGPVRDQAVDERIDRGDRQPAGGDEDCPAHGRGEDAPLRLAGRVVAGLIPSGLNGLPRHSPMVPQARNPPSSIAIVQAAAKATSVHRCRFIMRETPLETAGRQRADRTLQSSRPRLRTGRSAAVCRDGTRTGRPRPPSPWKRNAAQRPANTAITGRPSLGTVRAWEGRANTAEGRDACQACALTN